MNQEPHRLSWGYMIFGIMIAVVVGMGLNLLVGVFAVGLRNAAIATLILLLPGLGLVALSTTAPKNGFRQGLIIGACFVALVGGLCGMTFAGKL